EEVEVAEQCLHERFEEQVRRNPEAVAVVFGEERVTYGELNRRANQWAHYLQSQGVGPDELVGIYVERSIEMLVGLLAVLKAGGAYVPLDPAYPHERIAYMLEDAQIQVLLTQEKLAGEVPVSQAAVYCLDHEPADFPWEAVENAVSEVTPQNLAYVIYTSGSTGEPKGVLIEHQGLLNMANEQKRLFDITKNSRILQFASFSFDGSVMEFIMAFCHGASLYLGTQEEILPGEGLIGLIHKHEITNVALPPTVLRLLVNESLPSLQTVISAGEACSIEVANPWSKVTRLFNCYGPTEATIGATIYAYEETGYRFV
ncbi:AMP-binding protein, partial [Paenibacillus sp. Marseille-Q9583]